MIKKKTSSFMVLKLRHFFLKDLELLYRELTLYPRLYLMLLKNVKISDMKKAIVLYNAGVLEVVQMR